MNRNGIERLMKTYLGMTAGALMSITTLSAESVNHQINGSFEYASNPDIPDYWVGMGRWARSANGIPSDMLTKANVKAFTEKFCVDGKTAFHGSKSLRVEAPFFAASSSMDVAPEKDYVISVYLKSSRDNMIAELSAVYMDRDKPYMIQEISVSTEWKRYELKLPKYPYGKLSPLIKPLDSGKLWVDAVQIEEGSEASMFKPSPYDDGFTKPQQPIHLGADSRSTPPSVRIPAPVSTPPAIDGELEGAWKDAVCLKMNTMMGAPSETPTSVRLLYDADNMYMAFECDDPAGVKGKGDSIEIFMDILGIGSPYYQFIFDSSGKKYNYRSVEGKHEWDWKADWKVAVKENPKGGWIAEVAIPFAAMPESKEISLMESVKMNFGRNYSGGPELHLGWASVHGTFLEPEHFGTVFLSGKGTPSFELKNIRLVSSDASDNRFDLIFDAENSLPSEKGLNVSVNIESKSAALQSKVQKVTVQSGKSAAVLFRGFRISDDRCRAGIIITDDGGRILRQARSFIDTPHPLKIYPEFSYYTKDASARIKVEYSGDMNRNGLTLKIAAKLNPLPNVLARKEYPFTMEKTHIYDFPLSSFVKAHTYTLEATLTDSEGKCIARSECDIVKRDPNHTEAMINHFNRGVYIDGKPYIPYGYQIWLLSDEQLEFYNTLGHDYICYTGHWGDTATNKRFLSTCDRLGLKVMDFHAVRANADAPDKMLEKLKDHKSLFATTPVDECVDKMVPGILADAKRANPYLICYKNDNTAGYRFWRSQINGLPGEAVSIDRYPLIYLAKGRPQTTSLIYTFERALEMMDEDAKRERKPVFIWMEAAEAVSKEPTEQELTWFHYIAVVNHAMGFTYFGGVPMSRFVRDTVKRLDKELKAIQPFLFSFEDEPEMSFGNANTEKFIRILPKKLGNDLLLICVNRAIEPMDAEVNLSAVPGAKTANATVMFEGRSIKIGADNMLRDKFTPLGRHVYKIPLGK